MDMNRILIVLPVICFNMLFAQNIDLKLLHNLNKNEHPKWDNAMMLTSHSIYPTIIIAPTSLFLIGYFKHDKLMMRNGIKTSVAIGSTILITTGLKLVINRNRPFIQYPNDVIKRANVGPYSFPSGHTASAFATATALTLATKKWYVAVPSYLYACSVGYSRLRLGVHFPTDVLGGMVVGIGSSLLVWQIDNWLNKSH